MNRPWLTLFSQTGGEIYNVSSKLERFPSRIITNQQNVQKINSNLITNANFNYITINVLQNKPTIDELDRIFSGISNPIITLHGWLRIIPKELCSKYEIYNLHPGLITKFPELRGKDPQDRAVKLKHKVAGCVIHRVIPEVDAGEILLAREISITDLQVNEVVDKLHDLSTNMWVEFLKDKI